MFPLPFSRVVPCLFGLALTTSALAEPGDHIRVGDATITPRVDLGTEYRTNIYREEAEPVDGANLRVAPSLEVGIEGADHDFDFNGQWQIRQFFFVGESSVPDPRTQGERIRSLSRFNDFNLGAGMDLFKRSSVGLQLEDRVSLRNSSTDANLSGQPFNTQIRNVVDGALRLSPGPALAIQPGGEWAYDEFRTPNILTQDRYNVRNSYGPTLDVKWSFFPRSALVFNSSYMFYNWQDQVVAGGNDGVIEVPDSQHFKAMAGIEGKVSSKVYVDLLAGYGVATYDEATVTGSNSLDLVALDVRGLDGLLVTAQVRYAPSKGNELAAGYKREFVDAFFTNYRQSDMVYARVMATAYRLRPSIQHSIRFESYEGPITRRDVLHRFRGDLSYDLKKWSSITAGAWWSMRESADVANVEYSDLNLHLLATFQY